jgi:ribosomal protein S18 acetylase RimI-like enzyme
MVRIARGNSPNPRFRSARPGDARALDVLEQRCFALDRLSLRQYRRHLASPTARVLVAAVAGAIVAAAVVFLRRGSDLARLYSIAVDPDWRGHGLGAALLTRVERAARTAGARGLRLEVRADNTAAQALYAGAGYRLFGCIERYYEDGAAALRFERRFADRQLAGRPRASTRQ